MELEQSAYANLVQRTKSRDIEWEVRQSIFNKRSDTRTLIYDANRVQVCFAPRTYTSAKVDSYTVNFFFDEEFVASSLIWEELLNAIQSQVSQTKEEQRQNAYDSFVTWLS